MTHPHHPAKPRRLRVGQQLAETWRYLLCEWTHGGGYILRDPLGRINWQCCKCGRWSTPVPLAEEAAMTDAALTPPQPPKD